MDFNVSRSDNGTAKASSHKQSSSSDFGDFHVAHPEHSPTSPHRPARLDNDDLLMSFDEIDDPPQMTAPPMSMQQGLDLLTDDLDSPTHVSPSLRRFTSRTSISGSPTRSRSMLSNQFPGPSSPPKVTDTGAHIVFHPHRAVSDDAAKEMRRIRTLSNDYSQVAEKNGRDNLLPELNRTPSRSLVDVLAPSKLASRWKRSVLGNSNPAEEGPTKTALPIDISHKSPFASPNQITGSYVPPEGAPGFVPTSSRLHSPDDNEWANTVLVGRREMTEPVLELSQAQEIRPMLAPRQRLSNTWNLIFSLDQHGASLATLYSQVERYAKDHRSTGNLLVVRDSDGHKFGMFLNEPILKREGTYYGTGESFMFKFEAGESKPRVYRWTGRNQYIALCESGFISFGGGGNSYGLILDATFSRNSSATSPAFDNDVLCTEGSVKSDKGQVFDCIGVEVWATA